MTTLTKKQINWLNKCTKYGTWTLNPKTGLVDVEGSFDCRGQRLKGFKGVKFGVFNGYFWCENNRLTSLVGAPQEVGGSFDCSYNHLTSLVGAPLKVGESFDCSNNRLTSLVGAPQEVGGSFDCSYNHLTSLVGAPQSVGGGFWCSNNTVPEQILVVIFTKMKGGHSFVIAAASLRNEMSKTSWKLIAPHIPEAILPGVNMLARFGVFK
jgi:hypothetical protein